MIVVIILLILLIPLVLREGYKVAKKQNQLPEYWAWFGGFMIIVTVAAGVLVLSIIEAME